MFSFEWLNKEFHQARPVECVGWLETKRPPTYHQGKSRIQIFSTNEWYQSVVYPYLKKISLRPIVPEKKNLSKLDIMM